MPHQRHVLSSFVFGGLLCLSAAFAQNPSDSKDEAAREATARLELMQKTIAGFMVETDDIDDRSRLKFVDKPLLRYSDPTRGLENETTLLDASLWRLGESGRPTAIVTLEMYRAPDQPDVLAYEFLSFTKQTFELALDVGAKKIRWDATGTDLKLAPLPDAPKPAAMATARLRQLRELSRRFKVIETLRDEKIDCRLMTQPIDRYSDEKHEIVDGALFVFANGTNPEGGVLLETDGKTWSYGVFRLSAAGASVELDGREVASYPFFGEYGRRDGAYTSDSHPLEKK
jgi:hypothetical protein